MVLLASSWPETQSDRENTVFLDKDLLSRKGAGGRRVGPAGGDLGEFTFGKRWVIASVVASATTGRNQIASLHGLSEP